MPAVSAQSAEDIRESPKSLTCTTELSRHVAQLADVIAVVRPRRVDLGPPPYSGRASQLRGLKVVSLIRKPEWPRRLANSGAMDVDVEGPEMMKTADTASPIRAGQEYLFLLQDRSDPDVEWLALYPCGALSLNDTSLAMAHKAAASVEQSD